MDISFTPTTILSHRLTGIRIRFARLCPTESAIRGVISPSMESAITILEHMVEFNRMPDPEILIGLHHDVADALMKVGRVGDAERHLMRAMRVGIQTAGDRIDANGPEE